MNITTRTQYGLRALMDIAFHDRNGPVQRRHIALRQSIPTDYMDQLLLKLRAANLIHSFRGREGGYHLAKDANEINVLDIANAVEEESTVGSHLTRIGGDVAYATECITDPAVDFMNGAIMRQLRKYTLAMFLEEADERILEAGLDPVEVLNTRPGRELMVKARKPVMDQSTHGSFVH
jgi:Rrf2 family protein